MLRQAQHTAFILQLTELANLADAYIGVGVDLG